MFVYDTREQDISEIFDVCTETVKRWRRTGKIPAHCYKRFSWNCVRYCLPLLLDWQKDPDNLEAQAKAIKALNSQNFEVLNTKRIRKSRANSPELSA
jgi:hypothetical protein